MTKVYKKREPLELLPTFSRLWLKYAADDVYSVSNRWTQKDGQHVEAPLYQLAMNDIIEKYNIRDLDAVYKIKSKILKELKEGIENQHKSLCENHKFQNNLDLHCKQDINKFIKSTELSKRLEAKYIRVHPYDLYMIKLQKSNVDPILFKSMLKKKVQEILVIRTVVIVISIGMLITSLVLWRIRVDKDKKSMYEENKVTSVKKRSTETTEKLLLAGGLLIIFSFVILFVLSKNHKELKYHYLFSNQRNPNYHKVIDGTPPSILYRDYEVPGFNVWRDTGGRYT